MPRHQRSHYTADSSSPCRQGYLPSVSGKGEMGNETDVCQRAFWVICLIQGLKGSGGIKRLKQHSSFYPCFTCPSSLCSSHANRLGNSHCLFFHVLFYFTVKSLLSQCSNGTFSHCQWNSSTPSWGAVYHLWPSTPSLAHFDPWPHLTEPRGGSRIPPQVNSGDTGVESYIMTFLDYNSGGYTCVHQEL